MQEEFENFFCFFLFQNTKNKGFSFIFALAYFIWAIFLEFILQIAAKAVIILPQNPQHTRLEIEK